MKGEPTGHLKPKSRCAKLLSLLELPVGNLFPGFCQLLEAAHIPRLGAPSHLQSQQRSISQTL